MVVEKRKETLGLPTPKNQVLTYLLTVLRRTYSCLKIHWTYLINVQFLAEYIEHAVEILQHGYDHHRSGCSANGREAHDVTE